MKILFAHDQLAVASSPREFLEKLYSKNKDLNADFSYSFIAKACGFRAKSYLNEVLKGKKKLSLESAQKISHGLKMPKTVADFFHELVQIEIGPPQMKIKSLEKLERHRKKLSKRQLTKAQGDLENKNYQNLYEIQNWPLVYCSLGEMSQGASLKEIEKRCSLPETEILSILQFLIDREFVKENQKRYFTTENSLFLEGLSETHYFRDFFLRELSRTYTAARSQFRDKDLLFYNTVLSIDSKRMKEFRSALIELMNDFVSQVEAPNGDKVASLVCSFRI